MTTIQPNPSDPNRPRTTRTVSPDFRVFIAIMRDIALIAFAIVFIIDVL